VLRAHPRPKRSAFFSCSKPLHVGRGQGNARGRPPGGPGTHSARLPFPVAVRQFCWGCTAAGCCGSRRGRRGWAAQSLGAGSPHRRESGCCPSPWCVTWLGVSASMDSSCRHANTGCPVKVRKGAAQLDTTGNVPLIRRELLSQMSSLRFWREEVAVAFWSVNRNGTGRLPCSCVA
jgi:hypothetical protein